MYVESPRAGPWLQEQGHGRALACSVTIIGVQSGLEHRPAPAAGLDPDNMYGQAARAGPPDPRPVPEPWQEYHDTSNSWERNASAASGPSGGGPGPSNPGRARGRRVA